MVGAINELMDFEMTGQPYVKTALDVACWDILGRSLNTPLYMLPGGMVTPRPEVVGSIPPEPGEELEAAIAALRANGIAQFSGKTSGDVAQDIAYLRWMGERLRPGESSSHGSTAPSSHHRPLTARYINCGFSRKKQRISMARPPPGSEDEVDHRDEDHQEQDGHEPARAHEIHYPVAPRPHGQRVDLVGRDQE